MTYWDLEGKSGTYTWLRLHGDISIELLKDHLRNREAKTHSTFIDALRFCYAAEKFKEFLLII